jgi:transposase, IS5 family
VKRAGVFVQDGVPETLRPAELSFFSLTERLAQISRQQDPLERLDAVIDWEIFQPVLDRVFPAVIPKGPGGRPAYPRLFLCKILVLQRLYQLSDEATQYQILDRLSFQRFLGLNLADPVSDQNTVREFREALQKARAFASLFEVFSSFLAGQGLLPKEGVIVDASFVEVPRQRNTREENALVKTGQTPADWSAKKRAHKDVDARWTRKNAQTFYGYKDHLKVNIQTKLIETTVVTSANVHDSQAIDDLVQTGDGVVFGDSAYTGQPVQEKMEAKGVDTVIVQKGVRGRALNETEKAENREISRTRARVEHAFAVMSGKAGRIFQRYAGRARNQAAIQMMNLCYNLRRYEAIVRLELHPVAAA